MVAFGHTAIGVVVGVTAYHFLGQGDIANGLLITGASGIVSHYLMDSLPHGHFFVTGKYKTHIIPVIIFDLLLSLILFVGLAYLKYGYSDKLLYIVFAIVGSHLPDVIDGLIYTKFLKAKGILKLENKFHESMHWHGQGPKTLLLGRKDIWQILIIVGALLII